MNDQDLKPGETLSTAGQARREAMLDELMGTMHRVHRARRTRRAAVASVALSALVFGLAFLAVRSHAPSTVSERIVIDEKVKAIGSELTSGDVRAARSTVLIVRTDESIMDRYTVHPRPEVTILDDDALLDTLAALDRRTGLIRTKGRVMLTASVTDPIRGPHGDWLDTPRF